MLSCNCAKSNQNHYYFLHKCNLERLDRFESQIRVINDEKVFRLLERGKVGGPSIIFHRYHEADKTSIRHPRFDQHGVFTHVQEGELVERIVGYDASALYLGAVGEKLSCGELQLDERAWMKFCEKFVMAHFLVILKSIFTRLIT